MCTLLNTLQLFDWMLHTNSHCHESPAARRCIQLKSTAKNEVWGMRKEDMDKQGLESFGKHF